MIAMVEKQVKRLQLASLKLLPLVMKSFPKHHERRNTGEQIDERVGQRVIEKELAEPLKAKFELTILDECGFELYINPPQRRALGEWPEYTRRRGKPKMFALGGARIELTEERSMPLARERKRERCAQRGLSDAPLAGDKMKASVEGRGSAHREVPAGAQFWSARSISASRCFRSSR